MVRLVVLIAAVCAVFLALPVAARADGPCQTLIAQGLWQGSTHVLLDVKEYGFEDILVREFAFQDDGALSLNIGCNVTGGAYHIDGLRWLSMPVLNTYWECHYTIDFSQPTGVVVAGAGRAAADRRSLWQQHRCQCG